MLGETTTFTYAATTNHAWHQLCQSYIDAVIVTNKVAVSDVHGLCRRVRASVNLSDLPILIGDIGDDSRKQTEIETICREFNVDHLRAPYQPIVTRKRLQAMIRRHRLKSRLRGLMTNGLYRSTVDNLTGLYSRGFLYTYLEQSIQESRARGVPLSVATCRISGLADVNATLGYPVGDQLIAQLGRALARSCRAQDLVARVRGASFGVVLNDTSESEAQVVCERVAKILEEIAEQSRDSRLSHVHLTIGLAEMTASDGAETLIDRALQQPSTVALRKAS
jgi:diguanylate cyclase (GGDEF)-like protein